MRIALHRTSCPRSEDRGMPFPHPRASIGQAFPPHPTRTKSREHATPPRHPNTQSAEGKTQGFHYFIRSSQLGQARECLPHTRIPFPWHYSYHYACCNDPSQCYNGKSKVTVLNLASKQRYDRIALGRSRWEAKPNLVTDDCDVLSVSVTD